MSAIGNITFKYLRFFSSSRAVMAMTVISVIGIAIAVATLTITLSVAGGFGEAYRKAIMDFNAHVVLLSTDEIKGYKETLEKLNDLKVSEEERGLWKKSENLISLLKPVEGLWMALNQAFMDAVYNYPEDSRFGRLLDTISPLTVSGFLYNKGWYPKCMVSRIVQILKLSQKGVVGLSPFIYREGLLIYNGQIRGVVIKGADLEGIKSVNNLQFVKFPEGSEKNTMPVIYLGKYLAKELGVESNSTVRIMLPQHLKDGSLGKFIELIVGGTFESGMYDFDSQFVLLDLKKAQDIFGVPDTVSGVEIKLDDWQKTPLFTLNLERQFPYPFYVSNWLETNRSLFEAVKLEKLMFIIIMGALVVVAAFNIIGTIMLRILYKTSDISILRALGMNLKGVKNIFVLQGVFVGGIGVAIGLILALSVVWSINKFGWINIPPEIYLLKTLPVCISWWACVMIAAFSIFVCWMTAIVASRKVLELPVVKGLHRL